MYVSYFVTRPVRKYYIVANGQANDYLEAEVTKLTAEWYANYIGLRYDDYEIIEETN